MASINATSSSTTSRLTAKTGIGGLVSGMDIDELVENLTARSREKITKQQQLVQKLQWKQTAYRSTTSALTEFQSKYFNTLSSTNFKSKTFFNTVKATSSSDAVTVNRTSGASAGKITINSIEQLATNQTIESGTAVSRPLTSSKDLADMIAALRPDGGGESKALGLTLDGKFKTITFDSEFWNEVDAGTGTEEENFVTALQSRINTAFGANMLKANGDSGKLSFEAPGTSISILAIGVSSTDIGFTTEQSNKINFSASLIGSGLATPLEESAEGGYQVTINGEKFTFNANDSLRSIMEKINNSQAGVTISYSSVTDKFTMTSKESGEREIKITDTGGNLMKALGLSAGEAKEAVKGQNAKLTVNGETITRDSNTFNLDGVNITLNKEIPAGSLPAGENAATLTMKEDSSGLEDSIRKFVDDYNAMISLIDGLTKEKVYKDYAPLTEEQKADMTESQITAWESKAKSGILRGDSLLDSISTKLRSTIAGLSVNGFSLYSMGIGTAGWESGGKLEIKDAKLKEALEQNGDKIRDLFTSENGLSNALNSAITDATKTSGTKGNRGTLVEAAGVENTRSDTENSIYDQIKRANKNITTLQDRLKAEESRYWKKFSYMESMINNLNAQGTMISSFTNS